jgi:anti-sigma-K factor RskA
MSTDFHVKDLLPEYALGTIDDRDMVTVIEHLAECGECRDELAVHQRVVLALMLSAPEAVPAPDARERLMARIASSASVQPARIFSVRALFDRRLPGWAGVALVGAAVILIVALFVNNISLTRQIQQAPIYPVQQEASQANPYLVKLQATERMPQARGVLLIGMDGQQAILIVEGLEPFENLDYQLWLNRDSRSVSAGYFSVLDSGRMAVPLAIPDLFFNYLDMQVTIEPTGGSHMPTGATVMEGFLDLVERLNLLP